MKSRAITFSLMAMVLVVITTGYWMQKNRKPNSENESVAAFPEQETFINDPHKGEAVAIALAGAHRALTRSEITATTNTLDTYAIIAEIVDVKSNMWARQKSARALSLSLSKAEQQPLLYFLKVKHDEDDGQGGHVLKNDIMDALVAQETVLPGLVDQFISMYRDSRQNEVIRDYAVQHLSMLSERLSETLQGWTTEQADAHRQKIRDALWEVLQQSQSSIAGTALLGLTRLSENDMDVNQHALGQKALELAESNSTQPAARITALQACARLQVATALPLLRELTQNSQDVALRISAIGALGLVGGREEMNLLQSISVSGDSRLSSVSGEALARIQKRTSKTL